MALNNVKEKLMGSVGTMEREISKSKGKSEITACVYRNLLPLVCLVENDDENDYLIERLNSIGSINKQRRELIVLDTQKLLKIRFNYLKTLNSIKAKTDNFKNVIEENGNAVNDKNFEFFVRGKGSYSKIFINEVVVTACKAKSDIARFLSFRRLA